MKPKPTIIDLYHKYRDLYDIQNNVGKGHFLTIRLFRKELQIYFWIGHSSSRISFSPPVTIGLSAGGIQWVACPSGQANQKIIRVDRVLNCLNIVNPHNFANNNVKERVWQRLAEIQGVEVAK